MDRPFDYNNPSPKKYYTGLQCRDAVYRVRSDRIIFDPYGPDRQVRYCYIEIDKHGSACASYWEDA